MIEVLVASTFLNVIAYFATVQNRRITPLLFLLILRYESDRVMYHPGDIAGAVAALRILGAVLMPVLALELGPLASKTFHFRRVCRSHTAE